MSHPVLADLTNPDTNPLPDETKLLVAALLEGRVKSLFLVAEIENEDGESEWLEGYELDMDDHETDDRAFVGAVVLAYQAMINEMTPQQIRIQIRNQEDDDYGDNDEDDKPQNID